LTVTLVVVLVVAGTQWLLQRRFGAVEGRALQRQGLMALLLFAAILAVVVSLPIEDSTRGQLLSLIGLLVSAAIALSSTTFIGNMMAGVLLRVVRSFRTGDFIRIEGNFGRVSEQGLLHTEIQTEDRDLITLPNLFLVTHPVRVIRSSGTVVSADVSLGYDVDHHKVERTLLEAADDAGLKEPFVRILELGDFSISYRVAGMLKEVKQLLTARSRLRAAVIDHLHAAAVEIVSPRFQNQRLIADDVRFLPPSDEPRSERLEGDRIFPEELIFDKADQAESVGKLRSAHDSLVSKVEELEATLKDSPEGEDRKALERRLNRARELRERLARRIDDAEKS
jgi:small-conductance mechanosensitive channel